MCSCFQFSSVLLLLSVLVGPVAASILVAPLAAFSSRLSSSWFQFSFVRTLLQFWSVQLLLSILVGTVAFFISRRFLPSLLAVLVGPAAASVLVSRVAASTLVSPAARWFALFLRLCFILHHSSSVVLAHLVVSLLWRSCWVRTNVGRTPVSAILSLPFLHQCFFLSTCVIVF